MAILVGWQALAGAAYFSVAHASTEVIGVISADAKWTKAKSPYSLTGPVLVKEGVTLTIEAWATVNLNEYYIQVNGTLRAIGRSDDLIRISGKELKIMSSRWDEQTGSGSIIENAFLEITRLRIVNATPKINSNFIIGLIERKIDFGYNCGKMTFSNNVVRGVLDADNVLVINNTISFVGCNGGTIINNTIKELTGDSVVILNNTIDGGINVGAARISGNIITGTIKIRSGVVEWNLITGLGIEAGDGNCIIQNNTLVNPDVAFYLKYSGAHSINYNNIIGCQGYFIKLTNPFKNDVNATYNWWGTTDTQEISKRIYDSKHDFNMGTVTFIPFLTAPNPQAPEPRTRIEVSWPLMPGETPQPPDIEEEDLTATQPAPASPTPGTSSPTPTLQQGTPTPSPEIQNEEDQTIVMAVAVIAAVALNVCLGLRAYRGKKARENHPT
ncbi:MAG: hypothetical protein QXJ40_00930 [Candidatus Bathyarchaeia archaeon]